MAGRRPIDLLGQQFSNWTVLGLEMPGNRKKRMWRCVCCCGRIGRVSTDSLRRGHSRSCGGGFHKIGRTFTPPGRPAGFRSLVGRYKFSAAKRHHEWLLSEEEAKVLFESPCSYCGLPPQQVHVPYVPKRGSVHLHGRYVYTGIDRKDNAVGYTLANCVPCCARCNYAKGEGSVQDFVEWLERAYSYLRGSRA